MCIIHKGKILPWFSEIVCFHSSHLENILDNISSLEKNVYTDSIRETVQKDFCHKLIMLKRQAYLREIKHKWVNYKVFWSKEKDNKMRSAKKVWNAVRIKGETLHGSSSSQTLPDVPHGIRTLTQAGQSNFIFSCWEQLPSFEFCLVGDFFFSM